MSVETLDEREKRMGKVALDILNFADKKGFDAVVIVILPDGPHYYSVSASTLPSDLAQHTMLEEAEKMHNTAALPNERVKRSPPH